ncbi:MAG: hypothetical protein ABIB43_03930 [archaeon]
MIKKFTLYEHWKGLCSRTGIKDASLLYDKLKAAYESSKNGYHSLENHILPGLMDINDVIHMVEFPHALKFAWFLHDSVNVPGSKTNEEDSVSFAYDLLANQGLNNYFLLMIGNNIIATDHFNVEPKTLDEKIIVSVDLAPLGLPPEEFDRNTALKRNEYKMYSDEEFKKRTIEICKYFLDKETIYPIKEFEDKYESQARENMKRVIKEYS